MVKRKTFRKFRGGAGDIIQLPERLTRGLNYPPNSNPLYILPDPPFPPDYDVIPPQHGYNDGVDITQTRKDELEAIVNYNRTQNPVEAAQADKCKKEGCSVMGGRTKRNRRRRKSRRNRKGGSPLLVCPLCGKTSVTTTDTTNGPIFKCTECSYESTPWN